MADKEWKKPELKEVELEPDEDVLRQCFTPSMPQPEGMCPGHNPAPCPET